MIVVKVDGQKMAPKTFREIAVRIGAVTELENDSEFLPYVIAMYNLTRGYCAAEMSRL